MFNFNFAYLSTMQIILIFVSFVITIIFYTSMTNIILLIYGENVNFRRKALFVFLTGTAMNNIWIQLLYYDLELSIYISISRMKSKLKFGGDVIAH